MTKTLLSISAILGLSAAPLMAETMIDDTDSSGTYSMEEMQVAYPDLTEEQFAEVDTDESGDVTPEELTAALEAGVLATKG
ncbi:EF-hand domain-containing protein [Pseudooceanicola sp. MF1-13]|uniref:EF-hand domain-containing protein n=1 Tax=Pseudooceanicola sp. MF1-13 TaxID=3379095 RepID=UPI0038920D89